MQAPSHGHNAWSTLSERQVLKTTIKDERVGVRWDMDDWIQYIGDQRDVLEEMHFPRFRDDHPYVLIVRGDGFPCEARSWCQIACGFANHMQKARTLLYNWTLDEPGLDALFRIWATAGCGAARSASWFGADSVGRGGGHSAGHGPRFFFEAPVELPPGWFDELEVQRYTATQSSMLAMGATISGGGKHEKAKASAATAAAAPTAMAPSPFVQPSVVQAIQGVQQVCSGSIVVSTG